MARLVGVDLPRDKRIEVALTYIFGVGRTRALKTLEATGISGDKRVHELGDEELVKLRIFKVDGDYIRRVKAKWNEPLDVEKLVNLKIHGIIK